MPGSKLVRPIHPAPWTRLSQPTQNEPDGTAILPQGSNQQGVRIAQFAHKADAAFALKAINSHAILIDLAKSVLRLSPPGSLLGKEAYEALRVAKEYYAIQVHNGNTPQQSAIGRARGNYTNNTGSTG